MPLTVQEFTLLARIVESSLDGLNGIPVTKAEPLLKALAEITEPRLYLNQFDVQPLPDNKMRVIWSAVDAVALALAKKGA